MHECCQRAQQASIFHGAREHAAMRHRDAVNRQPSQPARYQSADRRPL
jgi:hypothetical protein